MDWQVGDLALCVDDRTSPLSPVCEVVAGKVYTVVAINTRQNPHDIFGRDGGGLELAEVCVSSRPFFAARRFRKIKPDTEPCEEEFTALIKRMKPAKVTQ